MSANSRPDDREHAPRGRGHGLVAARAVGRDHAQRVPRRIAWPPTAARRARRPARSPRRRAPARAGRRAGRARAPRRVDGEHRVARQRPATRSTDRASPRRTARPGSTRSRPCSPPASTNPGPSASAAHRVGVEPLQRAGTDGRAEEPLAGADQQLAAGRLDEACARAAAPSRSAARARRRRAPGRRRRPRGRRPARPPRARAPRRGGTAGPQSGRRAGACQHATGPGRHELARRGTRRPRPRARPRSRAAAAAARARRAAAAASPARAACERAPHLTPAARGAPRPRRRPPPARGLRPAFVDATCERIHLRGGGASYR